MLIIRRSVALLPPRINDVETGRTPQYPDVQPLHVSFPPDRVFHVVSEVAGRQQRWTVTKVDPAARTLIAEARTSLWRFVDDVTIRVEPEADGSVVNMRSRSRVGVGDFGANAKRIRAFLKQLDRAVKSAENGR